MHKRNRGSVLIEYLLLAGASIAAGTYALAQIADLHQQLISQIQTFLLSR